MKKVAALVILLVGLLASKAHDATSSVFTEGWSTTQATTSRFENSSKQSAESNEIVVVNWSLICTDLCGAGYGGPFCGEHCLSSGPSLFQMDNGKYDSVDLCPYLCKFDLGGRKCECTSKSDSSPPKNAKEFCSVLCKNYNVSINGCSECLSNRSDSNNTDLLSTSDSTVPSFSDPNHNETESVTTTAAEPATVTPSTTAVQTTSATTTISSTSTTWTTPDWSVMCKELCKKGEGGILCNCDLPPLTLKSN